MEAGFYVARPGTVRHTRFVPADDFSNWSELLISLRSLSVIRREREGSV